ncbi:unnamed protein product [Prunus brigantina]
MLFFLRMAEASSSVKTPLIPNQERSHELEGATISQQGFRRGDFVEEAKLQLWLAGPLIAVSLLQYSLQVTSVMYVGHLGELALSSASMASSFASVTGFSVLLGMGSALETLCGQAYGAKQYNMLGVHMQRAMLTLLVVSIPLALICFEYWSFEMVVLLSGLLPNPKLETSVLSISLNTCWMVYMISVGLGSAISTRVSNELGAGQPQGAQLALRVMTIMALSEGAAIATATVLVRYVWGKLYSNENEVIIYVAKMMPLLALSDFLDGFQCVLSGAARGCGWQNLCVLINLGAYYVVGIPTAVLFAFILHIGGMGLWMGIICGLLVQVTALVAVNVCTDWYEEATKAANRVQNTVLVIDKAT